MLQAEDTDLLRNYIAEKSDDAFAALVSKHLGLVYSAALRQVRDPHLAQEVAQTVFVLFSRKAGSLSKNVILSGWLYRATGFVATDALRAENRRRHRETAAMQSLYENQPPPLWEEIESLLDPAMAELSDNDRNLVLLRFFENKSLKEVGAALGVSEDAAQKKVARALQKLRDILARRGATASTAGLAGALVACACVSAPPALASSIVTFASASTAAVTVPFLTATAINLMTMTKLKLAGGALLILAAASIPVAVERRALDQQRAENQTLREQIQRVEQSPAVETPAAVTPAEVIRLRNEAAEVPKLRGQLAMLLRERAEAPHPATRAQTNPPDNGAIPQNPMDRQSRADKFVTEGKYAEALEDYLWCYDEGAKQSPSYVGVRSSFLLNQLASLAEKFPPAREALLSRRDAMETALLSSTSPSGMAGFELIQLNKSLGQPERTLSFFDQLPAENPVRGQLVTQGMEQFSNARRYQDIVDSARPEAVFDQAIMVAKMAADHAGANNVVGASDMLRRSAVDSGGRSIEALAAVNQTERANALADKIFNFDKTPETRAELLKHAARAGNAAVTLHIQSQ